MSNLRWPLLRPNSAETGKQTHILLQLLSSFLKNSAAYFFFSYGSAPPGLISLLRQQKVKPGESAGGARARIYRRLFCLLWVCSLSCFSQSLCNIYHLKLSGVVSFALGLIKAFRNLSHLDLVHLSLFYKITILL